MVQVINFEDILAARDRIKSSIVVSPCPLSIPLSEITGMQVYCKLEYLQRTGSFKERGASNALQLLTPAQQKRGVIAASAGNHALGLAYHGKLLGVPIVVVMPKNAPLTKLSNCEKLGAEVILHGNSLDEAKEFAEKICAERQLTYINGYDDPAIIAGQGSIGLEILEQVPEVHAVIIPIGGGGLVAGMVMAIKKLKPAVQIIGVEPANCASYTAARKAGKPVRVENKPTLADGLAVPKIGENAFAIARQYVDDVVTVDEHQIALAILKLAELEKSVVEGAGAAGLAACLNHSFPQLAGRNVILPLTGGNIDINILGRVLERGLASDGRLCRFSAVISDRPGGLARFAGIIADEGACVMDIVHDRAFASDNINLVTVHCVVETRDAKHIEALKERFEREGFQTLFPDLGDK
ncbi:MAG: threonine dehydratase [Verrucomicrobiales bacterium]|nr:threonine dehydratase [Verrucomicrobiales bacterium]